MIKRIIKNFFMYLLYQKIKKYHILAKKNKMIYTKKYVKEN